MSSSHNVTMIFAGSDKANAHLRHAQQFGPFSIGDGGFGSPYFTHLIDRKFRGVSISALFPHIFHVVQSCSDKQVIWVHARWIVTFVQDAKTLWNRPSMENPRGSMCEDRFLSELFISGVKSFVAKLSSLAAAVFPAARLRYTNFSFKAIFETKLGYHLALRNRLLYHNIGA